jgi:hypothetical protein
MNRMKIGLKPLDESTSWQSLRGYPVAVINSICASFCECASCYIFGAIIVLSILVCRFLDIRLHLFLYQFSVLGLVRFNTRMMPSGGA